MLNNADELRTASLLISITPGSARYKLLPIRAMICLLLCLCTCSPLYASLESLRVRINRIESSDCPQIHCFVSVMNSTGEPVSGLARSNFHITEQEKPIPIYDVCSESKNGNHAAVVLVLDRSGSMKGRAIQSATTAARDFIARLSATDEVSVVAFSNTIGPETPLSTDHKTAYAALERIAAGGGTALYDATRHAVDYVATSDATQKAVLILTDGKDTNSKSSASECIEKAQREGVRLYCIGLGDKISKSALGDLAEKTGGNIYTVRDPDDLVDVYSSIAALILHEYVITYQSPMAHGQPCWRNVSVQVNYHGVNAESAKQYVVSSAQASCVIDNKTSFSQLLQVRTAVTILVGLNLVLLVALAIRRGSRRS